MRHPLSARPGAALALLATCLMTTTPFAFSQVPAANAVPQGPQAIAPASTPEALSAELVGKTFFLRSFYQDDKLQFATDGKATGNPQRGSFALSGVEIDRVKFTKHSMEIEGHRVGLHFFGALPYEDDSKPFERIKVDPKKSVNIEIDRLVIEPEKKKKKKDEKKNEKEIAAKAAVPASADAAKSDTAPQATTASSPAATATAATAEPAVAPNHDPRVSFLELSKAFNVIFAPDVNESVIATLPDYWQNYFATKEGKARAERVDASVLRPGGQVKPPRLLTILDPASNDYAQKNNIAGMVFLQMVVDANGHPGAVRIVRPIGFGLDERAVDAVLHAQFQPGTLNGKSVPEMVNLQVTFRIYSDRTKPSKGGPPTQVAPRSTQVPPSNAPTVASTGTVSE